MKLGPVDDRILARRLAPGEKTAGARFIPDTAKERALEARVIAVGSGKLLASGVTQPLVVKPGDLVLIGRYSGSQATVDGLDHIVVREEDVLLILERQGDTP